LLKVFYFFFFCLSANGPGRCKINNGDCWHDSRDGHSFSACSVSDLQVLRVFCRCLSRRPSAGASLLVVQILNFFYICVNRIMGRLNAIVLQDLRVMVSKVVKVRDRYIG
jgi:hypothetical protein